ncbi:unnamed protein product [Brassicogethes aeneus]|uniref:WD and tetratricopeptide repeats protein 1 n=1 Tax=Brassicogethes aeneus TaxID=1431903 RepID=A0A9P0B1F4_BRAAE|nr:unnamed protein product [Brassicogethes aeneus]
MEHKLQKYKYRKNFLKLLQYREICAESGKVLKHHSQFTTSLVKRLGLEYELEGHKGCVNCLQWTPDGKHLASGSDDRNVILWDTFRHKKLQVIPTRHFGNIFSVKFLGSSNNIIATAAADHLIHVQNISESPNTNPLLLCRCHVNRIKRLAVSPEERTLFWSAAEDGLVLQYDLREPHECRVQSKVLVDIKCGEVKCIAVNPTKPHYIAVGANDCYIRMYDRRKIKPFPLNTIDIDRHMSGLTKEPTDPNCVQFYAPGHLAKDNATINNLKFVATYVSFNSAGSEMLVNIGGEQIYLFDVNNSRHINELQVPQFSTKNTKTESYKCCCHDENHPNIKESKINGFKDKTCACFYMRKAFQCYQRRWMGDLYSAARDYLYVIQCWPGHKQAYVGLIKCFIALKWPDEATRWLDYFCAEHPNSPVAKSMREMIVALNTVPQENEFEEEYMKKIEKHETNIRLDSRDYEARFIGHCNTTTDIKEANFLGDDGSFICAGSDEGLIFVWDRKTSSIVTALIGDVSIVNCIQPHPSACLIASSGIDPVVKLWSPAKEDDSNNPRIVTDINAVVEANQQRMSKDPFESMLNNIRSGNQYTAQDSPCRTC